MESGLLSIIITVFVFYIGYLFLKGIEKTANGISIGLGKGKNSSFGMKIFLSIIGFLLFIAWFASL